MEVKDTGSTILDRQSDQTKIHNALEFLDNFEGQNGRYTQKAEGASVVESHFNGNHSRRRGN